MKGWTRTEPFPLIARLTRIKAASRVIPQSGHDYEPKSVYRFGSFLYRWLSDYMMFERNMDHRPAIPNCIHSPKALAEFKLDKIFRSLAIIR